MTTLHLRKDRRTLILDGTGTPASMTTNRPLRRGTLTVAGTDFAIQADGPRRWGCTVGPAERPLLHLGRDRTTGIPAASSASPEENASWRIRRGWHGYRGILTRGADRIEVLVPRFRGRSAEVTVTGSWPDLPLLALAACFAVLSRRRGDTYFAMVIAASTHGH
jgi:hypothetical protein